MVRWRSPHRQRQRSGPRSSSSSASSSPRLLLLLPPLLFLLLLFRPRVYKTHTHTTFSTDSTGRSDPGTQTPTPLPWDRRNLRGGVHGVRRRERGLELQDLFTHTDPETHAHTRALVEEVGTGSPAAVEAWMEHCVDVSSVFLSVCVCMGVCCAGYSNVPVYVL